MDCNGWDVGGRSFGSSLIRYKQLSVAAPVHTGRPNVPRPTCSRKPLLRPLGRAWRSIRFGAQPHDRATRRPNHKTIQHAHSIDCPGQMQPAQDASETPRPRAVLWPMRCFRSDPPPTPARPQRPVCPITSHDSTKIRWPRRPSRICIVARRARTPPNQSSRSLESIEKGHCDPPIFRSRPGAPAFFR